jgi:hypothetical protein
MNSYAYGRNNPLKYVDETGEFAQLIPILIAAAALVTTQAPAIPALIDNYKDVLRVSPGVGDVISGREAVTGKDAFTGEALSPLDRALSLTGAIPVLGTMADMGRNIIKAGDMVAGLRVTKHAADGFVDRNMVPGQVQTALSNGVKYLDTRTNNLLHIVGEKGKGGYTVVTDAAQKTLVSVENFIRNLTPKNSPGRFKKVD